MSDVNYEAELMNRAQGERFIEAINGISEQLSREVNIAPQAQKVSKPVQQDFEFTYDGNEHTVRFSELNNARTVIIGGTRKAAGSYTCTAYLRNAADTWIDGTSDPLVYYFDIVFDGDTSSSWANASDQVIDDLLTQAEAGTIDLADYGWAIGDEREVTLSAMEATGTDDQGGTITVGETHAQQTVTLVLMDTDAFECSDGKRSKFVVGLKNSMAEYGYMNSGNTNSGSWEACARRKWCNYIFREAMPSYLKNHFKKFKTITAREYNAPTTKETEDYFSLFAEVEIFGKKTYSNNQESLELRQIAYYMSPANRIKRQGDAGSAYHWWERSPLASDATHFCNVYTDGSPNYGSASGALGLAPFGCL